MATAGGHSMAPISAGRMCSDWPHVLSPIAPLIRRQTSTWKALISISRVSVKRALEALIWKAPNLHSPSWMRSILR